jgi:hypothetical protein
MNVAEQAIDPKQRLEETALSVPEQARAIIVRDQATLDAAGAMLTERIKPLLKEAAEIFDPVISAANASHRAAIEAKKRVTEPLLQAEAILKNAVGNFLQQQERLRRQEEERLRQESMRREAEERRLADERRKEEEKLLNEQIQQEHAEEIEQRLEMLPHDVSPVVVEAICATPVPAPLRLAPEMPVYAPAPVTKRVIAPKGLSSREEWKAEITSLPLLCKAIAEGRAPEHYVQANMTALNQMARANKNSLNVPGVRAVSSTGVAARSRG